MEQPAASPIAATRPHLPIRVIGPAAAQALGGGSVTPFARFERSIYVESAAGDIACIGDASIGAGPLNALLAPNRRTQDVLADLPNTPIETDLGSARRWLPAAGPSLPLRPSLRRGLAALRGALTAHRLAEGLSSLLSSVLDGTAAVHASTRPLLRAAAPGIAALSEWLHVPSPVPKAVSSLIGLGPGLTPSGDDLLGGCLIALRRCCRPGDAEALSDALLPAAQRATGRISLAHLESAAAGYGAAALHDALDTVLAGDDPRASLAALARIGHSSGWDALVGVVLVLRTFE